MNRILIAIGGLAAVTVVYCSAACGGEPLPVIGESAAVRPDGPCFPHAPTDKFRRVLLFTGNGLNTVIYLGMYEAALDAGHAPDLLIGTCGGSIAAGIIAAFPDRQERLAFLGSPQFQQMMLCPELVSPSLIKLIVRSPVWRSCGMGLNRRLPNVYGPPVVDITPRTDVPQLNRRFPTDPCSPRVLMIATRVGFCPGEQRPVKPGDKLYTEVYFTDPETAERVRGNPAVNAHLFPKSTIHLQTDVVSGCSLAAGLRASLADFYFTSPTHIDGHYYLTGAINLRPLELAHRLACEVMMPFQQDLFPVVESDAFHSVYRFSNHARARHVYSGFAHHWIDLSDFYRDHKHLNLNLGARLIRDEADQNARFLRTGCEDERQFLIPRLRIVERVPEDHAAFMQVVLGQWQYGYDRMQESLNLPINYKGHWRNMNHWNTDAPTRRQARSQR